MSESEPARGASPMQSAIDARREKIIKLRESGLTYAEIGPRFGITKERVRQILTQKPKPTKPAPEKPDLRSKRMLTSGEAAILLGIHGNTMRRWANEGRLKFYRVNTRGDRRFRREDIDAFLAEGSSDAANSAD